jgi:hypothetical protein
VFAQVIDFVVDNHVQFGPCHCFIVQSLSLADENISRIVYSGRLSDQCAFIVVDIYVDKLNMRKNPITSMQLAFKRAATLFVNKC